MTGEALRPERGDRAIDYLEDIVEAARLARSYVAGMAKADFLMDRRTQQAIVMNLLIIGEADSRRVIRFPEFVNAHPNIPWQSMRGMRSRLAHGYFDINLDVVWDTVQVSLSELEIALASIARRDS
jgi:uncharacterized protein with HEPN domain